MKNRSLLMIVGLMFFSGAHAFNDTQIEVVKTALKTASKDITVKFVPQDISFNEKLKEFKKFLVDNVSWFKELSEKDQEAEARDLYFIIYPTNNMQKIIGFSVFAVVVGGFVAYKYFYQSEDKNNEEEIDKN